MTCAAEHDQSRVELEEICSSAGVLFYAPDLRAGVRCALSVNASKDLYGHQRHGSSCTHYLSKFVVWWTTNHETAGSCKGRTAEAPRAAG